VSAGDDLIEGARRIVRVLREISPGVPDAYLSCACLIAAGILKADVAFPNLPPVGDAVENAKMFVAGIHIGRDDRTESEKESCQGAA
jgi:hypothetical protein